MIDEDASRHIICPIDTAIIVPGIAKPQIIGIVFTFVLAFVAGNVARLLIRASGAKQSIYEDRDEFAGLGAPGA